VLDGLKPGEKIIAEGVLKVREGAPVTVLGAEQAAAMKGIPAAAKPTQP
jgi:hypothetical protein